MGAKRHRYGRQIRQSKKPAPPPMPRPPSFPMPLPAQVPGHRNAAPRPTQGKPPPGAYPAGLTSTARVQPRGCKGRSPLHKKTKNSPLPRRGRGVGGMGAKRHCYTAGKSGNRKSQPPPMPRPPSFPMPLPAQVPGHRNAAPRPAQGKPPAERLPRRPNQCRPGSTPGMQGAKPLA